MIVTRENLPKMYERNLDFNSKVHVLVEEIFQTERIGPIGYQMSTNDNFKEGRYKNIFENSESLIDPENDVFPSDFKEDVLVELGPVEKKLVAYINSVSKTLIVITGALGSGKTATLEFVRKYLKQKNQNKCDEQKLTNILPLPLIVHINFNEGYADDDFKNLIAEFEINLFVNLKRVIKLIYSDYTIMDAFLKKISNLKALGWEAHFDDFRETYILNESSKWLSLTDTQKCTNLLSWIEKLNRSVSQKINLLARLINFVKEKLKLGGGCFLFAFDNIDKLPDELQLDFLTKIFSLTEISRVKTIVPMRLTSFGWIRANESYEFAHYELAGHPPLKIIKKRIQHYLENRHKDEYSNIRKDIPNAYLDILDEKIYYLQDLINNNYKNRFGRALESFAGVSIRRGLHLARRVFINTVTDYKQTGPYSNDLIRSLIISNHEELTMYSDDRRLTNIFISQETNSHLFLNIRILQILNEFRMKRKRLKISQLLYHLFRIRDWNTDTLLSSINTLIYVPKRLAYVNGRSHYKDYNDLASSINDEISLTWSGRNYLEHLLYDLVYLQECFSIVDWKFKAEYLFESKRLETLINNDLLKKYLSDRLLDKQYYIPRRIDYHSFIERFSFVRFGLSIFLYVDIQEYVDYSKSGIDEEKIVLKEILFIEVILKVSRSILSIFLSQIKAEKISFDDTSDELGKWLDLLYIIKKIYSEFFKTENLSINEVIKDFESHLNQ